MAIASASTTGQPACILAGIAALHFQPGLSFCFEIACMQQKRLKVWGKRGILDILLPLPRSHDDTMWAGASMIKGSLQGDSQWVTIRKSSVEDDVCTARLNSPARCSPQGDYGDIFGIGSS